MLSELAADVICVEPPGESLARRQGPFADDVREPENFLLWWPYARGVVRRLSVNGGEALACVRSVCTWHNSHTGIGTVTVLPRVRRLRAAARDLAVLVIDSPVIPLSGVPVITLFLPDIAMV